MSMLVKYAQNQVKWLTLELDEDSVARYPGLRASLEAVIQEWNKVIEAPHVIAFKTMPFEVVNTEFWTMHKERYMKRYMREEMIVRLLRKKVHLPDELYYKITEGIDDLQRWHSETRDSAFGPRRSGRYD